MKFGPYFNAEPAGFADGREFNSGSSALQDTESATISIDAIDTVSDDTSTTATVSVDGSYAGEIDNSTDVDWIAVNLTAGNTYTIQVKGADTASGSLIDPTLGGIFDANGDLIFGTANDDDEATHNGATNFSPQVSGTYYIAAAAFGGELGTYTVSVSDVTASSGDPVDIATTPTSFFDFGFAFIPDNALIASMLEGDFFWQDPNSTTTTITVSFPQAGATFSVDPNTGYGPTNGDAEPWVGLAGLTATEQSAFQTILAQVEDLTNINFEIIPDNSFSAGEVRIAWTDFVFEDAAAWAYFPTGAPFSADIWLSTETSSNPEPGSFFNVTLMHELGHALGLKHPGDTFDPFPAIDPAFDGNNWTVMSTNIHSGFPRAVLADLEPQTFMYLDILALQYLYGADFNSSNGDDTYIFDANQRYYMTLWDTGGNDTLEFVNYTQNLEVTIEPDSWLDVGTSVTLKSSSTTTVGTIRDTVYIPPEVIIENVIGGSGDDSIGGNAADNLLEGRGGDDKLFGFAGDDILQGGDGADQIHGGVGNDTLQGGPGADILLGERGSDTAGYSSSQSSVTIDLGTGTGIGGDADGDILKGIERVIGSDFNDVLKSWVSLPEFQVNTVTRETQRNPQIVELAGGGFVVVWESNVGENFRFRIHGQLFDATGNAVGDEFSVSAFVLSDQRFPSVAPTADGGFVVVWQDINIDDISAQRFGADGIPTGAEFTVNTFVESTQNHPEIISLSNGGFVVVWDSFGVDGSSFGVAGQKYDGDLNPVGGEFLINSETANGQGRPVVAALADGGFVVTWNSSAQDGSGEGIFGQVFAADGNPVGDEFQVNSFTIGQQFSSSVSGLASGGFVVVWTSDGQDGSGSGVYGQRYDANGDPVGVEFRVNSATFTDQRNAAISGLEDGGFVVTWESNNQDGDDLGVFGQQFDANGNAIGGEFQINNFTSFGQSNSSVMATSGGGFLVAWQDSGPTGRGEIMARRFDANGDVSAPIVGVVLEGRGGNDTLSGGRSNDTLIGGAGADTLDGGAGSDTASYAGSPEGVRVDLLLGTASGGDAAGDVLTSIENLTGSDQRDVLLGDGGANILTGNDGNDVLWARGGDDSLFGGDDNDLLAGLAGNDTLEGGTGADTLDGGTGIDTASYASSSAGVRVDLLLGTASGGDAAGDTLSGIENLTGSDNRDVLLGDEGDNVLTGNHGNDLLWARGGNDTLYGGGGDDRLAGLAGDDLLEGGAGADILDGGAGNDTASYAGSSAGVRVDSWVGSGSGGDAEGDVLTSIENLTGSDSKDILLGSKGANVLTGNRGNDILWARGGDDTLYGGGGNDLLAGLDGNDILDGGRGIDRLVGGDGDDLLEGGRGADILDGGAGNDTASYEGSSSGVRVDSWVGSGTGGDAEGDTLTGIENLIGSDSKDILLGSDGANVLTGGRGNDLLWARGGDDTLFGGGGNDLLAGLDGNDTLNGENGIDRLVGGNGDDILDGGRGNDILNGGSGADVFVFSGTWGDDTLGDFEDGIDLLDFSNSGLTFADLTISQAGADTLVEDAFGNSITLQGITATDITVDDFLF